MRQAIKKWLETIVSLIRLRIDNRRELAVAHETYRLARKVMQDNDNNLAWDEGDHFSKVTIVFLIKNLHRLQSITLLCKKGLAKDAVPLLRGMFEELVDFKYMAADKARVQDFIDYDTYQRYKLGKGLERAKAENIDRARAANRTKELLKEWEKIKPRFTYKTKSGEEKVYSRWTRGNVREISEAVGLGEMYEYLFAYLSYYVHSTPISADDYVLGRSGNSVVLTVGASPTLVGEVAATASSIYLDMLRVADEEYKMGLNELLKPVEAALKNAAAERSNARKKNQG